MAVNIMLSHDATNPAVAAPQLMKFGGAATAADQIRPLLRN